MTSDSLSHLVCVFRSGNASTKAIFEFAKRTALEIHLLISALWADCWSRPLSPTTRFVAADQTFPGCGRGGGTSCCAGVRGRTTAGVVSKMTSGLSSSMGGGDWTTVGT